MLYDLIEKNPLKKFLILSFSGVILLLLDMYFALDTLTLGMLIVLVSFIYGVFLVKGKPKILVIGIILIISTWMLFVNEISKGRPSNEVIEETFLYWIISTIVLIIGLVFVFRKR